ncbi:unnamed protein product [Pleuronectes platessa]|uniref:Uncharacterized protein n=1 Tax=Pleuronectes platessa TaxID=8262 RepID=A0A9N7Z1K5_PLEPL|nr:unnamed protein product [Pleuronectes platessa]
MLESTRELNEITSETIPVAGEELDLGQGRAACSSDSLSTSGVHTAEELKNNGGETRRLSPKCHVSLTEPQR